uniref:Uncharacterized protein n=1 Tax=Labrus bergylta TaxID=56723 RepID=A0A3Q3GC09_9LABR
TLKDVEMEEELVQQDLRAKVRDTLLLEGEIEHLEQEIKVLILIHVFFPLGQIQNRRYEAIVRRLHCQMSRAQAVQRYKKIIQLEELKRQLGSSQDSAAADH